MAHDRSESQVPLFSGDGAVPSGRNYADEYMDPNSSANALMHSTSSPTPLSDGAQDHGFGSILGVSGRDRRQAIWDRFRGKGRKKVGWVDSARNVIMSSCTSSFFPAAFL